MRHNNCNRILYNLTVFLAMFYIHWGKYNLHLSGKVNSCK